MDIEGFEPNRITHLKNLNKLLFYIAIYLIPFGCKTNKESRISCVSIPNSYQQNNEKLDTHNFSILARRLGNNHHITQTNPFDNNIIEEFYHNIGNFDSGFILLQYNKNKKLIKRIESSPLNKTYIVIESLNDNFFINKTFLLSGYQIYQGIESKLGFKINKEYFNYKYKPTRDCPGCLVCIGKDSTDTDSGYRFNYLKVFNFCKNKGISIERKSRNDETSIYKVSYEKDIETSRHKLIYGTQYKKEYIGRHCWFISSANNNYSGIDQYYILDGNTGDVLSHYIKTHNDKPCKRKFKDSPYRDSKRISHLSPQFESIDTSYLLNLHRDKKTGLLPTANPNDSRIKYSQLNYGIVYEYDLNKILVKKVNINDGKIFIEEVLDSFFTDKKSYYANGKIESKKISSWLGFTISNSYTYKINGELASVKNNDSGYAFDYLSVLNFCYTNCIILSENNENRAIIGKLQYGDIYPNDQKHEVVYEKNYNKDWIGKPCWIIAVPDLNSSYFHIYLLDGETGKVLHDYRYR